MPAKPTPHRSPVAEERQRDPERSKRLLTEAAIVEFSARGYDGARISDIAERAGVNKQLISYYFGGKQGLYDTISDQWRHGEQDLAGPESSLPDVARAYARRTMDDVNLARLVIREGLDGVPGSDESRAAQDDRFRTMLADFIQRQKAGEIAADLDPGAVSLALFALCAAPASFPHLARALGLETDADGFGDWYANEVALIVTRLCETPGT